MQQGAGGGNSVRPFSSPYLSLPPGSPSITPPSPARSLPISLPLPPPPHDHLTLICHERTLNAPTLPSPNLVHAVTQQAPYRPHCRYLCSFSPNFCLVSFCVSLGLCLYHLTPLTKCESAGIVNDFFSSFPAPVSDREMRPT